VSYDIYQNVCIIALYYLRKDHPRENIWWNNETEATGVLDKIHYAMLDSALVDHSSQW
jgi:hypothetical protein